MPAPASLSARTLDRLRDYRSRAPRVAGKNWKHYAAATGAAVAGAQAAEATIVHVVPPNPVRLTINASNSSTGSRVAIDIDNDGNDDLALLLTRFVSSDTDSSQGVIYNTVSDFGAALGFDLSAIYTGTPVPGAWLTTGTTYSIRKLQSGDIISTGAAFLPVGGFRAVGTSVVTSTNGLSDVNTFAYGNFPADGTGLAGFGFPINGQGHLGWIRISIESAANGKPNVLEALEWAYETRPGVSIGAGVVPEPTGLALLAVGAAGVAALRRGGA